jgi:branched-chain amino acid transport system permease protein
MIGDATSTLPTRGLRVSWDDLAPPLVLAAILAAIGILTGIFGDDLTRRVITLMLINLAMVVGLQVFMGNSGVASFGHVGFMLLGAYGTVLLTLTPSEKSFILRQMPRHWLLHELHLPFFAALVVTGVIVAVAAGLIGIPLLRIGATAFGLTSFAFLVVIRIVAVSSDALTNGTRTLIGIPRLTDLGIVTVFAILFVVAAYVFKESRLGLQLRASREDYRAAEGVGINVLRVRWLAWVVSAFMTAVAGGLWAFYVTIFSPVDFWVNIAFLIISMLVIGGQASVSGAVVGAIVISLTSHLLTLAQNKVNFTRASESSPVHWIPSDLVGIPEFVVAAGLLLVLILRPAGIMGGMEIGRRVRRDRFTLRRGETRSPPGAVVDTPAPGPGGKEVL